MRRFALCLLLLAAPVTAHAQFRHDATGLMISPPDYFLRQGEDLLAPESLISCWYAPATADYPWVKLCAERLDRLPRADEKLSFQWRDRTVPGARARLRVGTEEVMQYSALLPLRLGTVRLDVVTPVSGSDEAKAALEATLDSVVDVGLWTVPRDDAPRPEDRSDRAGARLVGKVGMILLIAGIGTWVRQRRARRKPESEGSEVAA